MISLRIITIIFEKKNNYHLSEADNPPKSNAADNGEEVALIIFKLIRLQTIDSILFQKDTYPSIIRALVLLVVLSCKDDPESR